MNTARRHRQGSRSNLPAGPLKRGRAAAAWCLSLFLVWSTWPAAATGADATTLVGIEGFRVEVGTLSRAARALGIEETRLLLIARERLQRASLAVGDFPALLVVSLRVVEHPTTVIAYSLEVEVRQVVQLTRTRQLHLLAPTWTRGVLTMVARPSFVASVEDGLLSLLDQLVRDYSLVNGTRQ